MTDLPNPDHNSSSETEVRTGSERFNLNAARPTGRPIYEPAALTTHKRRRFSPWLVIPTLLAALAALLYFLLFAPKPRHAVATAGTLIYASDANSPGVSHLWLSQADGSGAHPLTSGAFSDASPAWTADGYQLAFVSDRTQGQNQIYVMDGDGKNVAQLTHNPGAKAQPAFAPASNSLLGYLAGGTLVVGDVTKGESSPLLPSSLQSAHPGSVDKSQQPEAEAVITGFAWRKTADSTNPGLAAVEENAGVQNLVVLPDLGSSLIRTQNGQAGGPPLASADSVNPTWAPDGARLAVALLHVQGLSGGRKGSLLAQFDASGIAQRSLIPPIADPAIGPQAPVFSPDGSALLFELWQQPDLASRKRLGLFRVPTDGSGTVQPLARGDAGAAQFSLDGKYVYFLARRPNGGHDLWRISPDGTSPSRVSDGKADVTSYALSPQVQKK